MGRPDKQQRRTARARSAVQSALARGRAADAAEALLLLPTEQREFALTEVARGMQQDLARAFAQREQPALLAWLGRTEQEPRLLALLGEHALEARWILFTASLRDRAWASAEQLWATLRPALLEHELFEPLDALVSARGRPSIAALARFEADAARLGYDTQVARAPQPAPASVEQVEGCCLRCFERECGYGRGSWTRFRDVTAQWLRVSSREIAAPLRLLCIQLSERELLLRARAGAADVLDVARFIAGLAVDAGATSEIEPTVALALRASARTLASQRASSKSFDALLAVATAAYAYDALRPLMAATVLGADLSAAREATRGELLRLALAAQSGSRALVEVALALCAGDEDEDACERSGPVWFVSAVEAALASPAELAAALHGVASAGESGNPRPSAGVEPCHAVLQLLPIELGVTLVDRLWDHASELVRVELSAAAGSLVERMREQSGPASNVSTLDLTTVCELIREHEPALDGVSNAELRAVMNTSLGQQLLAALERDAGDCRALPPSMEPLFGRLAARAAPYSVAVLEQALSLAGSAAEAQRLASAHLARLPTLLGRVRAMYSAATEGYDAAAAMLEDAFLEGITPSAADAAAALHAAERADAPSDFLNQLCRVVLQAVERDPRAIHTPEVESALALARRRVRPARTRKKKVEKRRSTPNSRQAAQRSPSTTDAGEPLQLNLAVDSETDHASR